MSAGLMLAATRAAKVDGRNPVGEVIFDGSGKLYGAAKGGGTCDTGVFTILHSFSASEGCFPATGLATPGDGNYYGTTNFGGANAYGTIFKITPTGRGRATNPLKVG